LLLNEVAFQIGVLRRVWLDGVMIQILVQYAVPQLPFCMQGVLTPFDRLEGFERKQKDKGEGPSCAGARSAGETSTSGMDL